MSAKQQLMSASFVSRILVILRDLTASLLQTCGRPLNLQTDKQDFYYFPSCHTNNHCILQIAIYHHVAVVQCTKRYTN